MKNGRAYRSVLEPIPNTKKALVESLRERGASLQTVVVDKGEWNERRIFFVVGQHHPRREIGMAMKGEKPDWRRMIEESFPTNGS